MRQLCGAVAFLVVALYGQSQVGDRQRDPAAWGSDHVGKAIPEYVTGDECLFCHRNDIGPAWATNRHQRTMRKAEPDAPELQAIKADPQLKEFSDKIEWLLGSSNRTRFLKPGAGFGRADLLTTSWAPPSPGKAGKLLDKEMPHWEGKQFNDACAGCHATAVEAKTKAFTVPSLDCFACHGDVSLNHTKDTSLIFLSKKKKDTAAVVTSICAQCHLRTGKSTSTGLPYPNQFVAGDNLFRDFRVDFSDEAIKALGPADGHILDNVRNVVVRGKEETTCLSCHAVHKQSSKKHHLLADEASCLHCHQATGSKKVRKPYEVHSKLCGY